ncbi:alpha/beta hydrolase [Mucilaginibacter rigui]|uniref:Alpha/beta hydrolase n=1 Tax=Mucilaginibacter rigui TaxID=534635 RepID=A0ABR7X5S6_9SPHI|nr:alpha/beta hydrolase [Mucilaginibacter rigui]MBD1385933.1 alpha/beta hydrolase [Mucilaginibacter rigui]
MKIQTSKNLFQRCRIAAVTAVLLTGLLLTTGAKAQVKNIVLVHGAWGDVSGWEGVYKILKAKGYHVDVVSNSDLSLSDDAASVRAVLARQIGPVILVGHSYGGAIITQAGDTSNVVGLVYVSAFAPDAGESLASIGKSAPPNPESGIMPPVNGLLWYDMNKFHKDFCPDLPAAQADFMAHSQTPIGIQAIITPLTNVAWKNKPTWYIVSTEDRMIPPDAERFMAKRAKAKVTEIKASHVAFISHPQEVANVIIAASNGVGK